MSEVKVNLMGDSICTKEFELPLHLQLPMRKAEREAKAITGDQRYNAPLNLYHQPLLEIQAVKDMMQAENIELEFDIPSDIELAQLALTIMADQDEEEDDDDIMPFFI